MRLAVVTAFCLGMMAAAAYAGPPAKGLARPAKPARLPEGLPRIQIQDGLQMPPRPPSEFPEVYPVYRLPQSASLVVESESFEGSAPALARKGSLLAKVRLSLPSAVRLEGEVPTDIRKNAIDPRSPLSPGTLLYAAALNSSVYCKGMTVTNRLVMGPAYFAPCLIDKDGDGRFDHLVKTNFGVVGPRWVTLTAGNYMADLSPDGDMVPLPVAVPYSAVEAETLPRLEGEVVWSTDFDPFYPGPIKMQFGVRTKMGEGTRSLYRLTPEIVFDGAPVTVDLAGISITVTGVSESGELAYRLSGGGKTVIEDFHFQVPVVTYYIAVPVVY